MGKARIESEPSASRRIPRARIPVDVLERAVYWALMEEGAGGVHAWAVVCSLNLLAHRQRSGTFTEPMGIVAKRIGLTSRDLQRAIQVVENCCEQCGEAPWIGVTNDSRIAFNVYDEWNPAHGGARPGSGRPQQSSGNQDARLDYEHGIQDGRTGNQAAPKACASLSEAETDTPGEEDPSETETDCHL